MRSIWFFLYCKLKEPENQFFKYTNFITCWSLYTFYRQQGFRKIFLFFYRQQGFRKIFLFFWFCKSLRAVFLLLVSAWENELVDNIVSKKELKSTNISIIITIIIVWNQFFIKIKKYTKIKEDNFWILRVNSKDKIKL